MHCGLITPLAYRCYKSVTNNEMSLTSIEVDLRYNQSVVVSGYSDFSTPMVVSSLTILDKVPVRRCVV